MGEITRVVVDAMGGDHAPGEMVKGAIEALKKQRDLHVILVGQESNLKKELAQYSYSQEEVEVVGATEVIETAEPPVNAIRSKKDSSLVVGMKMVKEGKADAFVSAGSSGAILVGGQLLVGRSKGVQRAPFAPIIPTAKGVCLLLDSGANVDARSSHLVQFAKMGSIYMKDVIGVKDPRVALLNIGAEEDKGNALTKETYPLLEQCEDIRFIGNIEARDVPMGGADVVVADAFAGNIALKVYEGTASVLLKEVKKGLMSSLRSKVGALLIKPALKSTLKTFDASEYGGAPMLGLRGLVVKTHGNATAKEFSNAIIQCVTFKEQRINEKIIAHLKEEEQVVS